MSPFLRDVFVDICIIASIVSAMAGILLSVSAIRAFRKDNHK